MVAHSHWYSADERSEAAFYRWEKAGDDVVANWTAEWDKWSGQQVTLGLAALDDISRHTMEPLYTPSMRTLQRLIEQDRPDVLICDVFAHSCIDIADHLSIPIVFVWAGGLGSFGLGETSTHPAGSSHSATTGTCSHYGTDYGTRTAHCLCRARGGRTRTALQ